MKTIHVLFCKAEARARLQGFETDPEYLRHCQSILAESCDPYALMVAATSINKLVTDHWNHFSEEQILLLSKLNH